MLTIAASHSAVKFSLATRGSIEVGRMPLSVNDAFGLGPAIPRYVIAGIAGSLDSVVRISSAIVSPFLRPRSPPTLPPQFGRRTERLAPLHE